MQELSSSSKENGPSSPLVCSACSLPPRRTSSGETIPLRKCTRCRVTAYHDAHCQRQHYTTHKRFCRQMGGAMTNNSSTTTSSSSKSQDTSSNATKSCCYRIGQLPSRGNCMISTRWIKPHESLGTMNDFSPAAAPVLFESQRSCHCAVCFGHVVHSAAHVLCDDPRYRVLVCQGCVASSNATTRDSSLRQEINAVRANPQIPKLLPTAILVYRICWALVQHSQISWEKSLHGMIAHSLNQADDPNAAVHEQAIVMTVASMLRHGSNMAKRNDVEKTLHRIPAILARIKVNAFTITTTDTSATGGESSSSLGIGLYEKAHFINHSCQPNAVQSFIVGKPGHLPALRLTADKAGIPANEEITISYLDAIGVAYQERQAQLRRSYHFACTCVVCQTEAGNPT